MSWGVSALILVGLPFGDNKKIIETINNQTDDEILVELLENTDPLPNDLAKTIFYWIAVTIWAWNGIYWFLFTFIFMKKIRRCIKELCEDCVQPLFCGCMIMGYLVFLSGFATFFNLIMVSWVLWWIGVLLALSSCFVINFRMFFHSTHREKISKNGIETILLLPTLPNIVAAATGASLIPLLPKLDMDPENIIALQKITILVCYGILGIGLSLSCCVLAVYFIRLLEKGVPNAALGNSVWIIVGPLGHGANTVLQLGRYVRLQTWESEIMEAAKSGVTGASFLVGIMMWGFGVFWLGIAIMTSLSHSKFISKTEGGLVFNLGYWTMIFPLATLTFATFQLEIYTGFLFFRVCSWIFGLGVVLGAVIVHVMTGFHAVFKSEEFWGKFK